MDKLKTLLDTREPILLDGAMGTMLMQQGLNSGDPPEEWNVLYPDRIRNIHRHYIDSGSNIILTNTFGGTRYRLKLHDLQERVHELNRSGAVVARQAADAAQHTVLVAGSMGPTGELLTPMGNMEFDDASAAFAEQGRGLADGGVDLLWIETMSDVREVQAAVEGIRSVSDLPICATMSFDTNGRTMMGVTPAEAVTALSAMNLTAVGGNCGNGIGEIEQVIYEMHQAAPDVRLIAKANAGIPQWQNGALNYDAGPPEMGDYARRVLALGASFVGGCCGNTPQHIHAIGEALRTPLSAEEVTALTAEFAVADDSSKGNVKRAGRRSRGRKETGS